MNIVKQRRISSDINKALCEIIKKYYDYWL